MSDTITCPNCRATLPAGASFCTSCGTRLGQASPPPAPVDPTHVGSPGLHDATQVYSPPPAASTPWQPASSAPAPPEVPAGGWAPPPPPGAMPTAPPTAEQPPGWVQAAQSLSTPAPPGGPAWGTTGQAAPAARPVAQGSPIGAALAVLGGILTLVAIFLPWVTSNLSDASLSGWDLTSGDKGFRLPDGSLLTFESLDPYVLLIIGAAGVFAGIMALGGGTRSLSRVLGVVLGLAVIGFMVRDWTSLASVVEDKAPADFRIESAIGFYLALAGGALLAISAAMPSASPKSTSSPGVTLPPTS